MSVVVPASATSRLDARRRGRRHGVTNDSLHACQPDATMSPMSATRVRLHAVSGKVVVEAEDRADIDVGAGRDPRGRRRRHGRGEAPKGFELGTGHRAPRQRRHDRHRLGQRRAHRRTRRSSCHVFERIDRGRSESTAPTSAPSRVASSSRSARACAACRTRAARSSSARPATSRSRRCPAACASRRGASSTSARSAGRSTCCPGPAVRCGCGPCPDRSKSRCPRACGRTCGCGGLGKVRRHYEDGDDVEVDVRTVSGKIEIAAR